jgi:hypothetical protein
VGNRAFAAEYGRLVSHHFLEGYRNALISIITAQFGGRELAGGAEGAAELARAVDLNAALIGRGLGEGDLGAQGVEAITEEEA